MCAERTLESPHSTLGDNVLRENEANTRTEQSHQDGVGVWGKMWPKCLRKSSSQSPVTAPNSLGDHAPGSDLKSKQDSFCLTRIIFGLIMSVLILIIFTVCAVSYLEALNEVLPTAKSLVSQSAQTDQNFFHSNLSLAQEFMPNSVDFHQPDTIESVNVVGEKESVQPDDALTVLESTNLPYVAALNVSEWGDVNISETAFLSRTLSLAEGPEGPNALLESLPDPAARIGNGQLRSYVAYIPIPFEGDSEDDNEEEYDEEYYDEDEDEYEDYDYEEDPPRKVKRKRPQDSNRRQNSPSSGPHSNHRGRRRKHQSRRQKNRHRDRKEEDKDGKMPFLVPLMVLPEKEMGYDSHGYEGNREYVDHEEELEFLDPKDIVETFQDFDGDDDRMTYAGENNQFSKRYGGRRFWGFNRLRKQFWSRPKYNRYSNPYRRYQSYRGRGGGYSNNYNNNNYHNNGASTGYGSGPRGNYGYDYSGPRGGHIPEYDAPPDYGPPPPPPPQRGYGNNGPINNGPRNNGPRGYGPRNIGYGPSQDNGPSGPLNRRDGPPGYIPPPPNPYLHQLPGPPYPFPPPRAPNKPLDNTRIHPSKLDPVYESPDPDSKQALEHINSPGGSSRSRKASKKKRDRADSGNGATVIVVHQETPYPVNMVRSPLPSVELPQPVQTSTHELAKLLNRTLDTINSHNIYKHLDQDVLLDGILPPEPPPRPPGPSLDVSLLNQGRLRTNMLSKRMGLLGEIESTNVMSRVPAPASFLNRRQRQPRPWRPRQRSPLPDRRRPLPPLRMDLGRRPHPPSTNFVHPNQRHSNRRGPYVEPEDEYIDEDDHYEDESISRLYNPNRGPLTFNRRQEVDETHSSRPYSVNRPYQDVQSVIDEEFQNNFEGFPSRGEKEEYPPNIFSRPTTSPDDEYPNTVYIHAPTTRRPIDRPPPLHPGVNIPGVSHPPDSGNIQDIINHVDTYNERIDHGMRRKNHVEIELHEEIIHDDESDDEYEEPGYAGYRPPIGYKGPTHPPNKVYHYPSYPGTKDYHPRPVKSNPVVYHTSHDDEESYDETPTYTFDERPKLPQVYSEVDPIKFDKHFNKFRPTETHDYTDHDHETEQVHYHPQFPKNPVYKPHSTVIPPVFENHARPENHGHSTGPDIYDGNGILYPPTGNAEVIEHYEYQTPPPKPVPPPSQYPPPANFDSISQGIFSQINKLSNRIPSGRPGVQKVNYREPVKNKPVNGIINPSDYTFFAQPPQVLSDTYSHNTKPEVNMFPVPRPERPVDHSDHTKYHNHSPTYNTQPHPNHPSQIYNENNEIYLPEPPQETQVYGNRPPVSGDTVYSHKPTFNVHNHRPTTNDIYTPPTNQHGQNHYQPASSPGEQDNYEYHDGTSYNPQGHRPAVPLDYDPSRPDGPDYSTGTTQLEDKLFESPSPVKSNSPMSIGLDVYPIDGIANKNYHEPSTGNRNPNKHEVLLHLNLFSKKPVGESNSVSIGPFSYNFERENAKTSNRRIQNDRMYHSIDQAPILDDSPRSNIQRKHLMEVMRQYGKSMMSAEDTEDTSHPLFGHINPVSLLKMFVDRSKQRTNGKYHTAPSNNDMVLSWRHEGVPKPNLQTKETMDHLSQGKPWYGNPSESDSKSEPSEANFSESFLRVEKPTVQTEAPPVVQNATESVISRPRQTRVDEPNPTEVRRKRKKTPNQPDEIQMIERGATLPNATGETDPDFEYYYYYYYDYVYPDDEELTNAVEELPNPSFQKHVSNGTVETSTTPRAPTKRLKVRKTKKGPPRSKPRLKVKPDPSA